MPYTESSEFRVLRRSPQVTIVNVQQFTKHAETGAPLHAENGFFKIKGATGAVEASYSHPFGMNEFEFGELTADGLTLEASEERHFQRPSAEADAEAKARQVTSIRREYTLTEAGSKMAFRVYLGVGGQPAQLHLQGELTKITSTFD